MFDQFLGALRRLFGTADSKPAARQRSAQPRRDPPPAIPTGKRWHAVVVHPGRKPCEAVRKIEDLRFLASEAPRLPLPGCDAVACSCRYRHYDDRRDDNPIGIEAKHMLTRPMRRDTD